MSLLIGFLAPLLVYLALSVRRRERDTTPLDFVVAFLGLLVVGAWTSVAVYREYTKSEQWKGTSQLAWIGVCSESRQIPLRLGGDGVESGVGWPGGWTSPALTLAPTGPGASLDLKGPAFVKLPVRCLASPVEEGKDGDQVLLGGVLLRNGVPMLVNKRMVTLRAGLLQRHLEIPVVTHGTAGSVDESATQFLRGDLGFRISSGALESMLVPLPSQFRAFKTSEQIGVASQVRALRAAGGVFATEAAELETWAQGVLLYGQRRGFPGTFVSSRDLYVSSDGMQGAAALSLPCFPATVLKPGAKLAFRLEQGEYGGLAVWFYPPWRHSSPLPPLDGHLPVQDGEVLMTFAAAAQPGEACFRLPLVGALAEQRFARAVRVSGPGAPRFGADRGSVQSDAARQARWQAAALAGGWKGIQAVTSLRGQDVSPQVAIVQDRPSRGRIAAGLSLALLAMLAGFVLSWAHGGLPGRLAPWYLGGILSGLWAFLCLRILLALRYALSPATLDALGVKGVGLAFSALAVGPALVILLAATRGDTTHPGVGIHDGGFAPRIDENARRAKFWMLTAYLFAVCLIAKAEFAISSGFWKNIPPHYRDASASWQGAVLVLAVFSFVAVLIAGYWPNHHSPRAIRFLRAQAAGWFEGTVSVWGPNQWRRVSTPEALGVLSLFFGTVIVVLLVLFWVVSIAARRLSFMSEVVGSFAVLTLAGLWLGSKGAEDEGEVARPGHAALITLVMVGCLVSLPLALKDVGSLYGSATIFLSLCVVLLSSRPRRPGFLVLGVLVAAVGILSVVFVKWTWFEPNLNLLPGEAHVRLITFKEGMAGMDRVLGLRSGGEGDGPNAVNMRNAIQHSWVHKAMVNYGGWTGAGFGNSPDRATQISLPTLRYDSVFSTYIAAEHGLIGGLALLLLSAFPLAVVLRVKPRAYEPRFGFILVLTFSFFLEGAAHACMNMGLIPFTGRNYPLLAVLSLSDLLHWTLVFAIAAQAFYWGRPGTSDRGNPDASPAVFRLGAAALVVFLGVKGAVLIHHTDLKSFDLSRMIDSVAGLIEQKRIVLSKDGQELVAPEYSPTSFLGQEVRRFNALSSDEKRGTTRNASEVMLQDGIPTLKKSADFDVLLSRMAAAAQTEVSGKQPPLFSLQEESAWLPEDGDPDASSKVYRLVANHEYNVTVTLTPPRGPDALPTIRAGSSTLRQQQKGHRLLGPGFAFDLAAGAPHSGYRQVTLLVNADGSARVIGDLSPGAGEGEIRVRRAGGKPRVLGSFQVMSDGLLIGQGEFTLRVVRAGGAIERLPATGTTRLEPGDRIEPAAEASGFSITLEGGAVTALNTPLVGPAWVMGRWSLATHATGGVPWLGTLADAASAACINRDKKEFEGWLGALTLDLPLQAAAQRFARDRGRRLYDSTLVRARDPENHPARFLPPRVAIAIVDVADGRTLALGGWPRTEQEDVWIRLPSGEVVPPAHWFEKSGPVRLRNRYLSDRNFDRMLMGSITKPLWAAGALAVHPGLDRDLVVFGGDEHERDVFGIPVRGSPWKARRSFGLDGRDGCDFTSFLARSDNRYQIRLGFLGLAERSGAGVQAGPGDSPSTKESLDGGRSAWRRFPRFPDGMRFSPASPGSLENLAEAPLFESMHDMFAFEYRRELDPARSVVRRRSFWTGAREDDVDTGAAKQEAPDARRTTLKALAGITPEAVNLALNRPPDKEKRAWTPRDYISILLGGRSNAWANVDFAGAFAAAVTGRSVTPHIVARRTALEGRRGFVGIAERLRPGLHETLLRGTGTVMGQAGRQFISSLDGVDAYAKTGTLNQEDYQVSRVALVLVRWQDRGRSRVDRGLVISVVAERGRVGLATDWLGDFLVENAAYFRAYFDEQP